jgi:hypothetical protein
MVVAEEKDETEGHQVPAPAPAPTPGTTVCAPPRAPPLAARGALSCSISTRPPTSTHASDGGLCAEVALLSKMVAVVEEARREVRAAEAEVCCRPRPAEVASGSRHLSGHARSPWAVCIVFILATEASETCIHCPTRSRLG